MKRHFFFFRHGDRAGIDPESGISELGVCQAHFDSIPSLFSLVYNKLGMSMEEGKEYVKNKLQKDYKKLSPLGQTEQQDRFNTIMNVLFVE